MRGQVEIVRTLVEMRADIHSKNKVHSVIVV